MKAPIFYDELSVFLKYKWRNELKELEQFIDDNTKSIKQGDFEFKVCSTEFLRDLEIPNLNFSTIVHSCFATVFTALNIPRKSISYFIRSPKFNMGDFWIGRPQVYILEFENQPKSANGFSRFSGEFGKLLSRESDLPLKMAARYFPASLREASDDIGIYLNQAVGLWIYSLKGLEGEKVYKDPNGGHLVYPHHIKTEMVEYFYASFKRLHERSLSRFSRIDDIINEKEALFQLKKLLSGISNYGEINDMFKSVWNVLGIDGLEKSIQENLALRMEEIRETKNWRIIRFGWFVSFVFSLLGTIQLSEKIIKPLWQYFGFWLPNDASLVIPFLFAITVFSLVILILCIRFFRFKLK